MPLAYLELIGGLAGDMFLAALLDAGLPAEILQKTFEKLPGRLTFKISQAKRHALSATQIEITCAEPGNLPQTYPALRELVAKLPFPRETKRQAQEILKELFLAEAAVHGESLDQVHLHELSAYDTLADIFGVLEGLKYLGVEKLYASEIPLGRGLVSAAHGPLPLPAPATLKLLEGLPVVVTNISGETVTPTGAVLLKKLVHAFGPPPPLVLMRTGVGTGQKDFPEVPNIARLWLGQSLVPSSRWEWIMELETDLDDQSPEEIAHLCERLRTAGALDVSLSPLYMKKGRLGTRLSVLIRPPDLAQISDLILAESTTWGLRVRETKRLVLPREEILLDTEWGPVRVKKSLNKFKIEYEDLKKISQMSGLPLREIKRRIETLANRKFYPED